MRNKKKLAMGEKISKTGERKGRKERKIIYLVFIHFEMTSASTSMSGIINIYDYDS